MARATASSREVAVPPRAVLRLPVVGDVAAEYVLVLEDDGDRLVYAHQPPA